MRRAPLRPLLARLALCAAVTGGGAGVAHGQAGMGPALSPGVSPQLTGEGAARPAVARPRLSAAVGVGATFDPVGFGDAGAHALPAFFGAGGIGDGLFGFDFLAYASSGVGRARTHDPIDRLGLDLYGVVRPLAALGGDGYGRRVARAFAAELGLGLERDGRTTSAGTRFVVHTGARIELPLTPAGASELRVRLGVRRDLGLYTPTIYGGATADATHVGDTVAELYGALVVVF